jgi:hypothetical protein
VCHAIKLLGGHETKVKTKVRQYNTVLKRTYKRDAEPGQHRREEKAREQKLQGMTDEQGGEIRAGSWSGNTEQKRKNGCREKRV